MSQQWFLPLPRPFMIFSQGTKPLKVHFIPSFYNIWPYSQSFTCHRFYPHSFLVTSNQRQMRIKENVSKSLLFPILFAEINLSFFAFESRSFLTAWKAFTHTLLSQRLSTCYVSWINNLVTFFGQMYCR